MKFNKDKVYVLTSRETNWKVYVKILDIYNTIEGNMVKMKRLLVKGDVEFPQIYEILDKHIGYRILISECKEHEVTLELLDDE